ncbi:hypothetical protein HNY73_016035 [Argiope bruennichi]|uniref:Uncharacterized protein n=1 Tax=Argiope bruennichi TaxID=94029 RepID=A0A8T0ELG5_ARGBR|nr:hypothetical protein HNY73_016035 [Argiope bruennichi]
MQLILELESRKKWERICCSRFSFIYISSFDWPRVEKSNSVAWKALIKFFSSQPCARSCQSSLDSNALTKYSGHVYKICIKGGTQHSAGIFCRIMCCLPVFQEMVVKEEYSDDMNIPEEIDDITLKCGTCENVIWDYEELHVLDCGCVHHLLCLLEDLYTLMLCPECKAPLQGWDYLILISEKELMEV